MVMVRFPRGPGANAARKSTNLTGWNGSRFNTRGKKKRRKGEGNVSRSGNRVNRRDTTAVEENLRKTQREEGIEKNRKTERGRKKNRKRYRSPRKHKQRRSTEEKGREPKKRKLRKIRKDKK